MGRSRIVLADGHDWNRGARGELFGGRSPLMHGAGRERGGRHMGSCRRGLQAYGWRFWWSGSGLLRRMDFGN
jgi:hypothetical protein